MTSLPMPLVKFGLPVTRPADQPEWWWVKHLCNTSLTTCSTTARSANTSMLEGARSCAGLDLVPFTVCFCTLWNRDANTTNDNILVLCTIVHCSCEGCDPGAGVNAAIKTLKLLLTWLRTSTFPTI